MTLSGRIGERYQIVKLLGSGAMGEVYRAIDLKMFDRTVAIKFLSERLTDSEEGRLRFRREIETSARLHHPNIVTIHDWGEHQGRDFFVMEFVDGSDLQGLLKAGISWDLEQRLEVAFQVADALDFAHRAGVIHRDVKPGNVMAVLSESGPRVKLVDFGIAHVERSNLTQAQSAPGTFIYMSPEQLRGDVLDPLDPRRDIFSLGIVLCELFTGHHPFEAKSEALITNRLLHGEPDPPSRHGPGVPPELQTLILRMLANDPAQRPGTAREVAEVLRDLSRKAVVRSASSDPTFTGLDDLERQLVENLVTWARQKESEGALGDALAAYEKAARFAPDSERIKRKIPELADRAGKQRELEAELRELERHLESDRLAQAWESLRKARLLGPDDPRLVPLEARVGQREEVTPEARERKEFVAPRMKEVDSALDEGRIDESLAILSQVLRKYPDQADAAVLLDRLVEVSTGGIAYGDYRAAIRNALTALRDRHLDAASASCERAKAIWPDGPEAQALESELSAARDDARIRAEETESARLQEEKDRVRRQDEILERYMDGARDLLTDARAIEPSSPGESTRAIEAFGKVIRVLDLVLTDRSDHPGARALRQQVVAESSAREKALVDPEPPPKRPKVKRVRPGRIVAAIAIGAVLLGVGAIAIRKIIPLPLSKELEEVLRLPERSEAEVDRKKKGILAIEDLLARDDRRKEELAKQEERLVNLHEMYVLVQRLENLRSDASAPTAGSGEAEKLRSVLEYLSGTFDGYRSKLADDDPTARSLAKKEASIISEIEDRIGAE